MVDLTLKTGDKIKVTTVIDNATDGWSGEYKIGVYLKDPKKTKGYFLSKNLDGTYSFYEEGAGGGTDIKETISAGTSLKREYIAPIPDTDETTIEGEVFVWDGTTFVAESELADVYKYQKKKYSMSLSVTWEKG